MSRWAPAVIMAALCAPSLLSAAEPTKKEVDEAIERGLRYLQQTQIADGSWGQGRTNSPAITSLAVMAFLSAGHVPGEGRYGETVERGIRSVLKTQLPNGLIATVGGHEMYHHGIATLMLAEAAGMTQGKLGDELRQKLEKAVVVILDAQRKSGPHKGGWRYRRDGFDGDMSVTGWQIMALRAAKNLGCDVPAENIDAAIDYVKRCNDPLTGGYRYFPSGGHVTTAVTGTSILTLELCGKEYHRKPELLKAGSYILKHPPSWAHGHFFYAIYYCSQATFQLGGNYWDYYRPQLQQTLLRQQNAQGYWPLGDGYGTQYATAMAILALTVEYRYLPIYQRSEEPAEKK